MDLGFLIRGLSAPRVKGSTYYLAKFPQTGRVWNMTNHFSFPLLLVKTEIDLWYCVLQKVQITQIVLRTSKLWT